jgi:hypothetical protein
LITIVFRGIFSSLQVKDTQRELGYYSRAPGLPDGIFIHFQTKNPNLGKFWWTLEWKMSVYFMGIFYGKLVYFMAIFVM